MDLFAANGFDGVSIADIAGAAGVLSTRDTGQPGVVVEEPLAALAALAHAVVERLPTPNRIVAS